MTGEQLVVIGLLAVAFAAGWLARGGHDDQADEHGDLGPLLDRGGEALERALTACHATVAMWRAGEGAGQPAGTMAVRILIDERLRLGAVADDVRDSLGSGNPLAVDLAQAAEAASLVEREMEGYLAGDQLDDERGRRLDAYEGAFRDARMRFGRESEVARALTA